MAYIDREKLIDVLRNNFRPTIFTGSFLDLFSRLFEGEIMRQPTADVAEVKHGEWDTTDTPLGRCCVCSVCGSCPTMEYNYCPYCGAKMDGGKI